jgi:xylulokinase
VSLYLGFDCSTQSLTAIVLDATGARSRVVFESSLQFDTDLPQYGTRHGVLPPPGRGVTGVTGVAVSSPLLWADALDTMMARVARAVDLRQLHAIAGSAQQHGSVYLNDAAGSTLGNLDARRAPGEQLAGCLSRAVSPIWMDSSTAAECDEIARAVGGASALAARTGSRAFERFTGPQIRRFYKAEPRAFAATDRIHLVSSFLASLLAGCHAPIDPGDASGTNLMDLATSAWWPPALEATAPSLARRLPQIAPSWTIVGEVSRYWRERHGLPAARVVVWSGDNPCSLIGTGLVREGLIAVSLGTSDTVFGLMREPSVDPGGTGHVFGAPTGGYMALTCFANGSLARERIRDAFGLTWPGFSAMLASTPPGNRGRVLLPWFDPEITPAVSIPGIRRYGLAADDGPGNVRGVVEAQMMSMALHSQWMGVEVKTIHATGGGSANREILQVMADVFDAGVSRLAVENSACLGAALRARHADALASGQSLSWDDVVRDVVRLAPGAPGDPARLEPDTSRAAVYRELLRLYAACEAHALGAQARADRDFTSRPLDRPL